MSNGQHPPKWADRLLEWYCKPELLEDLQGALYEYYTQRLKRSSVFKANVMYILDVLMHFRLYTVKRKTQLSNVMLYKHFKVSIRNISKNKLSTSLNIIGLASGLASFILIVLWVSKELSYDRFHEKGDRIYRISNTFTSPSESFSQAQSGPALGAQLPKIFTEVEKGSRFITNSQRVKVNDEFYFEDDLGVVDPDFLEMFSFTWLSGDKKTALARANTIVLTQTTARKYFDNNNAIGQTVEVGGTLLTVTGVIADPPEESQMQFTSLVLVETIAPIWEIDNMDERWRGGWFKTYLLLAENTDPIVMQAEITKLIQEKLSNWGEQGMFYQYFLTPLFDVHFTSDLRYDYSSNGNLQNIKIFLSAAFLILLLACINYINLATAGAIQRSKEVGIRKVMGAMKRQLITQYLVESFLIVLLSVGVSLVVVYALLPLFAQLSGFQDIELFTLNHLWFLIGLILMLTFSAGFLPAVLISRVSPLKVINGDLKSGVQFYFLRKSLVIAQFSATILLLISMFVVNSQMSFINTKDLGMDTESILRIDFHSLDEVTEKSDVIREKLLQLPTIKAVSFMSRSYPVDGLSNSTTLVEDGNGDMVMTSIYTLRVDEGFANTFGLQLVAGRFFSLDFPADSTKSIIVNEACVNSFGWTSIEAAIGKKFGEAPFERSVVGVVKNFNFEALHFKVEPARLLPARGSSSSLAVKADISNTFELVNDIQGVWSETVPDTPLDITFMSDDIKRQYTAEYNFKTIFTIFSIISIIIGCLGLFGLATAAANQRLREISIRKVLGASLFEVVALINKEFIFLVVIAAVLASPVAYLLMTKWLDNFTYHISFDWQFVLWAMTGSLLVTIFTISLRAFRTALCNPADVLRD